MFTSSIHTNWVPLRSVAGVFPVWSLFKSRFLISLLVRCIQFYIYIYQITQWKLHYKLLTWHKENYPRLLRQRKAVSHWVLYYRYCGLPMSKDFSPSIKRTTYSRVLEESIEREYTVVFKVGTSRQNTVRKTFTRLLKCCIIPSFCFKEEILL